MGFILMFDLTSEQSFINVRNWLTQLQCHAYCDDPDVILVGNKADREDARVVSASRAKELAEKYSLPYLETSAFTAQNVKEAIELLLEKVMIRMEKTIGKYNVEYLSFSSVDLRFLFQINRFFLFDSHHQFQLKNPELLVPVEKSLFSSHLFRSFFKSVHTIHHLTQTKKKERDQEFFVYLFI